MNLLSLVPPLFAKRRLPCCLLSLKRNPRTPDMTKPNHNSRVWDIIEKAPVGMLTTRFAGGLRARHWKRGLTAMPASSGS